jgi:hypothetical protein
MPTASPKLADFSLPFPRSDYSPETESNYETYECQAAAGVWVALINDNFGLLLGFYSASYTHRGNRLQDPQLVALDPILILALIHDFILTHKVTNHGKSND